MTMVNIFHFLGDSSLGPCHDMMKLISHEAADRQTRRGEKETIINC